MIDDEALRETVASILVVNDFFDDIIRDADSHTVDQAVVMRHTIGEVIKKAREAMAALDVFLTGEMPLYEPVNYRGMAYTNTRKSEQKRTDHGALAGIVQRLALERATDRATGEIDWHQAVREAVDIMRRLYLNDSIGAKSTVMKQLGIPTAGILSKVPGDKVIAVVALQAGDQEARED